MAELESHYDPRQLLSILRHHVLGPVLTAESLTERVRTEVANERDAFEAFADRIATITVDSPRPPALMAGSVDTSVESSAAALLRDGFEATVMAVPHYDDVYGESVEEHASAEFGPDLASLLSSKTSTTFTQSHKKLLVAAPKQRARDRDGSVTGSTRNCTRSVRDDAISRLSSTTSTRVSFQSGTANSSRRSDA